MISFSLVYAQSEENASCGIESCHGLDITCGANTPQMCTEMYALGDFCRRYAQCEIINGMCQFVQNSKFDACKRCVGECNKQSQQNPVTAFDCEGRCRLRF